MHKGMNTRMNNTRMNNSRRTLFATAIVIALSTTLSLGAHAAEKKAEPGAAQKAKKHLLVVSTTTGFRHDSIPLAREVIEKLGNDTGSWDTDFADAPLDMYGHQGTPDEKKALHDAITAVLAEKMSAKALAKYDAVVFANTTGELPLPDPQAFLDYIKAGHGFAAIHSGSDTFHSWPTNYEGKDKGAPTPYVQMLGGEFLTHHAQSENSMIIRDPNHPAMKAVAEAGKKGVPPVGDIHKNTSPEGQTWRTFDEIYLLKNNDPTNLHVLLDLDKYPADGSPDAGKAEQHLIAWSRLYGKGRVFYTVLGHRQEMWHDPYYQDHVKGALLYVLGLAKGSATPGK